MKCTITIHNLGNVLLSTFPCGTGNLGNNSKGILYRTYHEQVSFTLFTTFYIHVKSVSKLMHASYERIVQYDNIIW